MYFLLAGFVSDVLLFWIQSVWLLYQYSVDFIVGGLGVVCWIMACRTAVARVTSLWSLSQSPEQKQTFVADRQPLDIPLDWCVLYMKYFIISLPRTPHLLTVERLLRVFLNHLMPVKWTIQILIFFYKLLLFVSIVCFC